MRASNGDIMEGLGVWMQIGRFQPACWEETAGFVGTAPTSDGDSWTTTYKCKSTPADGGPGGPARRGGAGRVRGKGQKGHISFI